MKLWVWLVLAVGVLAGCSGPAQPTGAASTPSVSATASASGAPSAATSGSGTSLQVVSDWTTPTAPLAINHKVDVPPVPVLLNVEVSRAVNQPFTRVVFEFSSAIPGYTVQYVRQIISDGGNYTMPVPGSKFLRVTFSPAQAHGGGADANPPRWNIIRNVYEGQLVAYTLSGDYEGHASLGFGLQKAAAVRLSEQRNTGLDGKMFLVALDLQD